MGKAMEYAMTYGWVVLLLFIVGGAVATQIFGVGTPRGQSTYTGYVVDAEIDKGIVFRPSTIHLKTDQQASSVEEFCLVNKEQEDKARQLSRNQTQVTVTYSRPLAVPIWKCQSGLSIVESIEDSP